MATRDLERLSAAIQDFANSARFNFLKTLQVGRFVGSEQASLGVVSEFTFEKLVELGSKKLAKLRWLTPSQEEQLIGLLRALAEGTQVVQQSAPPPRANHISKKVEEEEPLNSVEVEINLRNAIKAAKSSPEFEQIASQSVGTFWDPEWPRAPFEEALTIEQLSDLDLTMLMKKRTMTNKRIDCIAKAIERAVASLGRSRSEVATAEPLETRPLKLIKSPPLTDRSVHVEQLPWNGQLEALSPISRAAAEHFLLGTNVEREPTGPLERLLRSIPFHMSAQDFVALASSAPVGEGVYRRLSDWTQSDEFIGATAILRSALEGPGVKLAHLADAIDVSYLSKANSEIGVTVIVRALGATEVSIGRSVCTGIWTLNPGLCEELLKIAKRSRDPREALSKVCPSMTLELTEWILSLATAPRAPRKGGRKILPN